MTSSAESQHLTLSSPSLSAAQVLTRRPWCNVLLFYLAQQQLHASLAMWMLVEHRALPLVQEAEREGPAAGGRPCRRLPVTAI